VLRSRLDAAQGQVVAAAAVRRSSIPSSPAQGPVFVPAAQPPANALSPTEEKLLKQVDSLKASLSREKDKTKSIELHAERLKEHFARRIIELEVELKATKRMQDSSTTGSVRRGSQVQQPPPTPPSSSNASAEAAEVAEATEATEVAAEAEAEAEARAESEGAQGGAGESITPSCPPPTSPSLPLPLPLPPSSSSPEADEPTTPPTPDRRPTILRSVRRPSTERVEAPVLHRLKTGTIVAVDESPSKRHSSPSPRRRSSSPRASLVAASPPPADECTLCLSALNWTSHDDHAYSLTDRKWVVRLTIKPSSRGPGPNWRSSIG